MATLGNTTTPTAAGGTGTNLVVLTPVTSTEAGAVTLISMYIDGGGTAGNLKPLIYGDSSGVPSPLLATGTPVAITGGQAAGWVSTAISYTFTSGQKLWIGCISDGGGRTYSQTATGTTSYFEVGGGAGTYASPANPITGLTADANNAYGFYLTYTPSGGGGATAKAVAFAPRHPHLFYDS